MLATESDLGGDGVGELVFDLNVEYGFDCAFISCCGTRGS